MKKLFILAAAIVAFASCSKEPEAIVNDGSIYFTSAQTRATGITDIATLAENNFKVYAYTTGENGYDVYAGVEAIAENKTNTTEATIWKPTAVKYWAENETYNFLGLYPKEF